MFEILDMVHSILEEQKTTAEEQLQLNKIATWKISLLKAFQKINGKNTLI